MTDERAADGSEAGTLPDLPSLGTERRNRAIRAAALAAILLFVLGGLLGGYGVHTGHVSGRSPGGLEVAITYPDRARPGLAVPYELEITKPGGFDGSIEVSTTTSYLEVFDENGREPEPAEATVDRENTTWTFDPPDGDVLVVWLDNRVEPGVQWRRRATTTVTADGQSVTLRYATWIFP